MKIALFKNKRTHPYIAIFVFLAINLAFLPFGGLRFDTTEEKLFTLSKGTHHLLKNLEHSIDITVYASRDLLTLSPTHARYYERVRILLDDFSRLSKNSLTIRHVQPESFSEEEDQAVLDGIRAINLNAAGKNGYFGLSIKRQLPPAETDNLQIANNQLAIPFLNPARESFIEYDLAKIISELDRLEKPRIGFIGQANPFGGGRSAPWQSMQQLQDGFRVIPVNEPIDLIGSEAPDLLWIVHPSIMEEDMLYAFDQYLLGGGKAMIFLDPFYETALQAAGNFTRGELPERSSTLDQRLLKKWGFSFNPEKIVTDGVYAVIIETSSRGEPSAPAPHLAWLNLREAVLDQNSAVTFGLSSLILAGAGVFEPLGDGVASLERQILVSTSTESGFTDKQPLAETPPNLKILVEQFKPDNTAKALAVRLSGESSSIFPNGPNVKTRRTLLKALKKRDGQDKKLSPHLQKSTKPMQVVLSGDVDMLHDRFWVEQQNFIGERFIQSFSGNGAFLLNIAETLAGDFTLSHLRNRTVRQRPFTLVESLRLDAERRFRAREQVLSERLIEIENKLDDLDTSSDEEILKFEEEFTNELLQTRQALRVVQRNLGESIDYLILIIKVFTIGFIPSMIALITFLIFIRHKKRRQSQ